MVKLEYYLLAESLSVDQLTNRLSLFQIAEDFATPSLPLKLTSLVAVSTWNVDQDDLNKDFQVTLVMRAPSGTETKAEINFTGGAPRQRLMQHFRQVNLSQEGRYTFELRLNGEHVANHFLDVRVQPDDVVPEDSRPRQ